MANNLENFSNIEKKENKVSEDTEVLAFGDIKEEYIPENLEQSREELALPPGVLATIEETLLRARINCPKCSEGDFEKLKNELINESLIRYETEKQYFLETLDVIIANELPNFLLLEEKDFHVFVKVLLIISLLAPEFFGTKDIAERAKEKLNIKKQTESLKSSGNYSEEIKRSVISDIFMDGESFGKTEADLIINFENKENKPPQIEGIENSKLPINKEELGEALRKLPMTLSFNANKIKYEDVEIPIRGDYGLASGSIEAAHATSGIREITFSKGSLTESKDWILNDCIYHEIAHLSFKDNRLLSDEDKAKLTKEIVERVCSEDRYKSSYVEKIQNEDKKIELRNKTVEYYAEIVSAYYSGDPTLPEEDVKILKQFKMITDDTERYEDAKKDIVNIRNIFSIKLNEVKEELHEKAKIITDLKEEAEILYKEKNSGYEKRLKEISSDKLPTAIKEYKEELEKEKKDEFKTLYSYISFFKEVEDPEYREELLKSQEMANFIESSENIFKENNIESGIRNENDPEKNLESISATIRELSNEGESKEEREKIKEIFKNLLNSHVFLELVDKYESLPKG